MLDLKAQRIAYIYAIIRKDERVAKDLEILWGNVFYRVSAGIDMILVFCEPQAIAQYGKTRPVCRKQVA